MENSASVSGLGQGELNELVDSLDKYQYLCKDEWDAVLAKHTKIFSQSSAQWKVYVGNLPRFIGQKCTLDIL